MAPVGIYRLSVCLIETTGTSDDTVPAPEVDNGLQTVITEEGAAPSIRRGFYVQYIVFLK
jgi:hypothetical protein